MKAIVFREYGSPDLLGFEEVPTPAPEDDEVLIKVHAASVNSWDWELMRGTPFANRMIFGLRKPRVKTLGADVAGRVEAIGARVNKFKTGDEVYGDLSACGWGAFAEYVCTAQDAITLKPDGMTFEQAAALPQAASMALQGLRDKRQVQPGQNVLINGAGGGVGTFAVQIAKSFGAQVTGVDSTEKLDLMRSLGASHVIDYTQEDYTRNGQRYDLILDVAAHRSISDYKRALAPEGVFVFVGGSTGLALRFLLRKLWSSWAGSQRLEILMAKPNKDMEVLKSLFEAGSVLPVIDKRYGLAEVAEAIRYLGEGHAKGKVVIVP